MTKMSELSLPTRPKSPEFRGGTWIAQLPLRMLALTSSLALTGCLAFDEVELPEIPDYPPSVVDDMRTPYPSTGIVELDFSVDPAPDSLQLMVILRDPNISQTLTYRVFVDGQPNEQGLVVSETVDPTLPVHLMDREVTVEVPIARLRDTGCHRVELIVSGGFGTGVDLRAPALTNDFASLVWWVRSSDTVGSNIDLQACPGVLVPVQRNPEPT